MRRLSSTRGFSLLELSIVLLIIGVISGGLIVIITASVEKKQFDETKKKLVVIQRSLLEYRRVFNRLPCPGDLTLPVTGTNFGREAAKANPLDVACASVAPGVDPDANFTSGNVQAGLVPVKTLSLPDDYAFDGWGRRIMYTIDNRFTVAAAFNGIAISDVTPRITIQTWAGTTINNNAAYTLVSFGANGYGAYSRNGSVRIGSNASSNVQEQENCDCTGAPPTPTIFNNIFVQAQQWQNPANFTDKFDDLVVYATRQHLRLPRE